MKRERRAIDKLERYEDSLYGDAENLTTEELELRHDKMKNFIDNLVISELKRLNVTIPYEIDGLAMEIKFNQMNKASLSLINSNLVKGALMNDVYDSFVSNEDTFIIPTYSLIQITSFFPDNVNNENFMLLCMAMEAGALVGLKMANDIIEINNNGSDIEIPELAAQQYPNFNFEDFLVEWNRLGIKNMSVTYDQEERLLFFWESIQDDVELSGLYKCDCCGSDQVTILDGLAMEILTQIYKMDDGIDTALLITLQYGFNQAYEDMLEDEEMRVILEEEENYIDKYGFTQGELDLLFNHENNNFWIMLRGMLEGRQTKFQIASNEKVTQKINADEVSPEEVVKNNNVPLNELKLEGIALSVSTRPLAEKIISYLHTYNIRLTRSDILEGKNSVFIYFTKHSFSTLRKECYTQIEDELFMSAEKIKEIKPQIKEMNKNNEVDFLMSITNDILEKNNDEQDIYYRDLGNKNRLAWIDNSIT